MRIERPPLRPFEASEIPDLLDRVPLFAQVTREAKEEIAKHCDKKVLSKGKFRSYTIPAGTNIIQFPPPATPAQEAFIIVSGLVVMERPALPVGNAGGDVPAGDAGEEKKPSFFAPLALAGSGGLVGDNSLATGLPHVYSARALTKCYLLQIGPEFRDLAKKHPTIMQSLLMFTQWWIYESAQRHQALLKVKKVKEALVVATIYDIAAALEAPPLVTNNLTAYDEKTNEFSLTWIKKQEHFAAQYGGSRDSVNQAFQVLRRAGVLVSVSKDQPGAVALRGPCKHKIAALLRDKYQFEVMGMKLEDFLPRVWSGGG